MSETGTFAEYEPAPWPHRRLTTNRDPGRCCLRERRCSCMERKKEPRWRVAWSVASPEVSSVKFGLLQLMMILIEECQAVMAACDVRKLTKEAGDLSCPAC
jgi:hypothetical protein